MLLLYDTRYVHILDKCCCMYDTLTYNRAVMMSPEGMICMVLLTEKVRFCAFLTPHTVLYLLIVFVHRVLKH